MKLRHYISSLLLTGLMLVATVGVGIYKHSCLMSGHEGVSVFFAESGEEAQSCCAITKGACKKPIGATDDNKCCEETADYLKLDIPQKNQEQYTYQAPLLPAFGLVALPDFDFTIAEPTAFLPHYHNLPPPLVQERLATLQVYRI